MNRFAAAFAVVALLVSTPALAEKNKSQLANERIAAYNGTSTSQLAEKIEVKRGHLVALYLTNYILTLSKNDSKWSDIPIMAIYGEKENKLSILILGSRDTMDGAKESIDDFRKRLLSNGLDLCNTVLKADVSERDIQLRYTNRKSGKHLITFKDAKYVLDSEDDQKP